MEYRGALNENTVRENKKRVEKDPCRFFGTRRGCRNGDRCRFAHVQSSTSSASSFSPSTADVAEDPEGTSMSGAVEDVANNLAAVAIDDSKAVVVYDADTAAANIADAILKESLIPQRKRRPGSELEKAKCSCCSKGFNLEATPEASAVALRDHYIDRLGKTDRRHLKFFRDHYEFEDGAYCVVCDRSFPTYVGLFRHLRAKVGNNKRPSNAEDHQRLFEAIVRLLVERDTGFEIDEEEMVDELKSLMTDESSASDEDAVGLLLALGLVRALGGMRSRNVASGGFLDDSSSDDECGRGMLGFSGSDVEELLCQGVKPWDSDAEDVLAALNGYY